MNTSILAAGHFEQGADILRDGKPIYRVPSCTHWDDDAIRVIVRDGQAVAHVENRPRHGQRSFPSDEWADLKTLGPVEGLTVTHDCPRGCNCEDCQ